ncbi:putative cytosol aminopeptidase [Paenibacillus cisolokensis]|uniref:Probable cytosol aminopeptidase n=1 Tax=Paenibacillus cisolokensis TaxID=1658519 RepID=A0ABQ4NDI9_9BACL|nr:leucyl aminopeptidase [Paenibacillus cisolokensis]GIQ66284.1 putative cytosol aminopeptidase [Paenibacillus cisolokensis]
MKFEFRLDSAGSAQGATAIVRPVAKSELQREAAEAAEWVHPQIDDALRNSYAKGLFKAEPGETETMPTFGLLPADYVIFAGLDDAADDLRLTAASAAKAVKRLKADRVQVVLPAKTVDGTSKCEPSQAFQALVEGWVLGAYERRPRKREEAAEPAETTVVFAVAGDGEDGKRAELWKQGIERGRIFAEAVCYARDLVNTPGNELTPEGLAEQAEELAARYELECEVLDEWSAAEQGMGGLLGVGQGSVNPPRMIVLHYEGAPGNNERWGLVGKGITFDTGGISLKRAEGMENMISDMSGAAAVLGVMQIIGELKPAVNVVAVIAAAENMPSDRALKPGDVIRMMNGLTVEVVNTDAEGRLVLADGLTTAIRRGATRLIDVATLTGAVTVALGDVATGAVSNDEVFLQNIMRASFRTGEKIWPLPSYREYRKQLKSDAADLKNTGGRKAGTITGGLFIGEFAEEKPWVHLDIAGTAYLDKSRGWEPKGATGVMVRTLAELLTTASS